jgi:hypothetical protein
LKDHTSHAEALWGVYATHWFDEARSSGSDLYYLGYRNDRAQVQQGTGREIRKSFGTRWFGVATDWYWNIEGVLQTGRLADRRVSAWTLAGEVGKSFPDVPLKPGLTLRADVASGDKSGTKARLEGFNPLFLNGKYFGELSPGGPRNLVDVHPVATINLNKALMLGVAAMA